MMPAWAYLLLGLATLAGGLLGGIAINRKVRPEMRKIEVDTVDVNVRIAGELRDDALEDRNEARDALATLRREFDQYRMDTDARLTELGALLRSEKAENERLRSERDKAVARVASVEQAAADEIGRLRERVQALEGEVRELKANGNGHHASS